MGNIFLFGKNGDIKSVTFGAIPDIARDKKVEVVPGSYKEAIFNLSDQACREEVIGCLCHSFGTYYKAWKKYGSFGDLIQLRVSNNEGLNSYEIDYIGNLAPEKAVQAADILPFFRDGNGNIFFVAIERGYDPGKGKLAFIGGFRDVIGFHYETGAEACLREGYEEVGLKAKPSDLHSLRDQNRRTIPLIVDFAGKFIYAELKLIGIYPTDYEEKNMFTGLKRVYDTTVYALIIDFPGVTEEMIRKELIIDKREVKRLMVLGMDNPESFEFGLSHHTEIFLKASLLV